MKNNDVYMGTLVSPWMNTKNIKYITFSVTDDCNLMCEYCFFTHKSEKNRMNFEVAKKAIDYILSDNQMLVYDGVVWDFIGGEPTIEMDLIDHICDYILFKMYSLNHKWLYCYRFMIGTNGLLYDSSEFQNFIKKHNFNLHVNVTIDGNKEKHDLSRLKKDGSGSYDDVIKILPLWIKQTGNYSTKATFAHKDLPYLKDSIIHLWNLGLKNIAANVVFENVWHEGDELIYEEQLKQLADYIIENKLWNLYSVRFFSPKIGYPIEDRNRFSNTCGTGNMLAIDFEGNFFPCIRFMNSSLNNKKGRTIGNVEEGMLFDRMRAFNALTYDSQSSEQCKKCEVSSGCSWCTGFNYDQAKSDTIFERQTFNCKMHKANVRANKYFWDLYEKETGLMSPLRYNTYTVRSKLNRYLYIYNNDYTNTCHVVRNSTNNQILSGDNLVEAVKFCDKNSFIPVFVGFPERIHFGYYIGSIKAVYPRDEFTIDIVTHQDIVNNLNISNISPSVIYNIGFDTFDYAYEDIIKIIRYSNSSKINVICENYNKWRSTDLQKYSDLLELLLLSLVNEWENQNYIQIDCITDNIFLSDKKNCEAGTNQWALAPNGMIYNCIGEYFAQMPPLVDISSAINYEKFKDVSPKNKNLHMCDVCNVKKCHKCYLLNKAITCEESVAFELHCVKQNIELMYSIKLLEIIKQKNMDLPFAINEKIFKPNNLDPLVELHGNKFPKYDYNKIYFKERR